MSPGTGKGLFAKKSSMTVRVDKLWLHGGTTIHITTAVLHMERGVLLLLTTDD